jgi:hypothetical protein
MLWRISLSLVVGGRHVAHIVVVDGIVVVLWAWGELINEGWIVCPDGRTLIMYGITLSNIVLLPKMERAVKR